MSCCPSGKLFDIAARSGRPGIVEHGCRSGKLMAIKVRGDLAGARRRPYQAVGCAGDPDNLKLPSGGSQGG
jgi:hypothetical protein